MSHNYKMEQPGSYQGQAPYNGGQQQQYYDQSQYPPPPNGTGYGQAYPPSGDYKMPLAPDGYQGERFEPQKPKFQDIPFAILFILVFGGFVATSVIALRGFSAKASDTISTSGGLATTLNGQTAVILMFSAAIALVLSLFYIFLVRTFTKIILEVSLALSVITSVAYCVYLWVKGVSVVPETSQTVCMAHITYSKRREPLS